jgi:hypothetical protein
MKKKQGAMLIAQHFQEEITQQDILPGYIKTRGSQKRDRNSMCELSAGQQNHHGRTEECQKLDDAMTVYIPNHR